MRRVTGARLVLTAAPSARLGYGVAPVVAAVRLRLTPSAASDSMSRHESPHGAVNRPQLVRAHPGYRLLFVKSAAVTSRPVDLPPLVVAGP